MSDLRRASRAQKVPLLYVFLLERLMKTFAWRVPVGDESVLTVAGHQIGVKSSILIKSTVWVTPHPFPWQILPKKELGPPAGLSQLGV